MIHHKIYPKNYDELCQLVDAKNVYQEGRIRIDNQVDGLRRLGLPIDENHKSVSKLIMKIERQVTKEYVKIVKQLPIWNEWLKGIHGISEDGAGQLISGLNDISQFDTVSKLWSYVGYGLYDGNIQGLKNGQKHNYNHKLRAKVYTIIDLGFVMHKKDSYYGQLYDVYKKEYRKKYPEPILNPNYVPPKKKGGKGAGFKQLYTDGHIRRMCIRKIAKKFLKDLWINWRKIEGLSITEPYNN